LQAIAQLFHHGSMDHWQGPLTHWPCPSVPAFAIYDTQRQSNRHCTRSL